MSQAKSPTISIVFPIYNQLIDRVEAFKTESASEKSLCDAIDACNEVLKIYYSKTDDNDLYTIAASN